MAAAVVHQGSLILCVRACVSLAQVRTSVQVAPEKPVGHSQMSPLWPVAEFRMFLHVPPLLQ